MKALFALLLALSLPVAAQTFTTETVSGIPHIFKDAPSHAWVTWTNEAQDTWISVDATRYGVPADAKAVMIDGILAITHGTMPQICGEQIAFRSPDQLQKTAEHVYLPYTIYIWQTGAYFPNDGARSTGSVIVPLVNGRFEYAWHIQGEPVLPIGCLHGGSFAINGYLR